MISAFSGCTYSRFVVISRSGDRPLCKDASPWTGQGSIATTISTLPCPPISCGGQPSLFVAYRFDLRVRLAELFFSSQTDKEMEQTTKQKQAIPMGRLFMTRGVNAQVAGSTLFSRFILGCVGRHRYQDWGDSCAHDKEMNDYSLQHGGRLISSYNLPDHLEIHDGQQSQTRIWIITEACRSYTTVLFPSEY